MKPLSVVSVFCGIISITLLAHVFVSLPLAVLGIILAVKQKRTRSDKISTLGLTINNLALVFTTLLINITLSFAITGAILGTAFTLAIFGKEINTL